MKALSTSNIMTIKHKTLDLSEPFKEAFGTPERFGIWFVWGKSGNGKSDFTMKICKEFAAHYNKIIYNSKEEKFSLSFKRTIERNNMIAIGKKIMFVDESIDELDQRLEKRGSASITIKL
jgi:predicted ATP-dependent serine protease